MTRKLKLVFAAAAVGALAACNPDDSGNVMAAPGNALTPAQVDMALGPELTSDPNMMAVNEVNGPGAAANRAGEEAVEEAEPRQQEIAPDNRATEANSAQADGETSE